MWSFFLPVLNVWPHYEVQTAPCGFPFLISFWNKLQFQKNAVSRSVYRKELRVSSEMRAIPVWKHGSESATSILTIDKCSKKRRLKSAQGHVLARLRSPTMKFETTAAKSCPLLRTSRLLLANLVLLALLILQPSWEGVAAYPRHNSNVANSQTSCMDECSGIEPPNGNSELIIDLFDSNTYATDYQVDCCFKFRICCWEKKVSNCVPFK